MIWHDLVICGVFAGGLVHLCCQRWPEWWYLALSLIAIAVVVCNFPPMIPPPPAGFRYRPARRTVIDGDDGTFIIEAKRDKRTGKEWIETRRSDGGGDDDDDDGDDDDDSFE